MLRPGICRIHPPLAHPQRCFPFGRATRRGPPTRRIRKIRRFHSTDIVPAHAETDYAGVPSAQTTVRHLPGGPANQRSAAYTTQMGPFETESLGEPKNLTDSWISLE